MYIFQKVNMASEDVQAYTRSGRFYDGEETAETQDGAVVVIGDLVEHEVYTGTKDLNVFKISAPTAVTDSIALVDYVGVSRADVVGVSYNIGDKTWGYPVPKDWNTRIRIPVKYDQFYIGADNFVSEPTVGEYATVTPNDIRLTPVATPTAGQFCVKIEQSQNIITGMVNNGLKYLCTVVSVAQ